MARRSDHSREELLSMVMAAAREIVEAEGYRGLTARRVATKIGYAPGTLYNLYTNLDDMVLQLRGETLDALYDYLVAEMITGHPEAVLINIANHYIAYVRDHPRLWNVMFEHILPEGIEIPDWYHEKVLRLFSLVETAIDSFYTSTQEDERFHHAQVLWAALHGICSLQIAGKLVKKEPAEAMAESLITKYVEGLRMEFFENRG